MKSLASSLVIVTVVIAGIGCTVALAQNPATDTFTIDRIEPVAGEKMVKIHFTDAVEAWSLGRSIRTMPPVSTRAITWYQDKQVEEHWLYLGGEFKHGESYTLLLSENVRSRGGRSYQKSLNRFTMPDLDPSIRFIDKQTVIERDSRQMIHADIVNIDEVLYEGVAIPPILIPSASALASQTPAKTIAWFEQACRERNSEIQKSLQDKPDFAPFTGEVAPSSNLFFTQIKKNEPRRFSMPLSFRDNPQRGALQFIRLRDNNAKVASATEFRLFRITDLGISFKISGENLLVWTTSLHTGKPLSGVSVLLLDTKENAFAAGKTSKEGLLELDGSMSFPTCDLTAKAGALPQGKRALPFKNLRYLVAVSGDDCAFAEIKPKEYLKRPEFEDSKGVTVKATAYTERGAYRPGETVHFKATVRTYRNDAVSLPTDATCAVVIENSRQEKVYDKDLEFSAFGSVYDNLPLKSFAKLGTYTLFVNSASPGHEIARCTFEVQEFRPPRHKVDLKFRRDSRKVDDYVNLERVEEFVICTITGQYYVGGPVKNGQVRWKVHTTGTSYNLPNYPDYTFGYPSDQEGDFLETAESMLSETGEVEVRIPLGVDALAGMHGIKVSATVVDFDGRTATGSGVYQEPLPFRVGAGPHPDSVESGVRQVLPFIVVKSDGKKLNSGEVEVSVLEHHYWYDRKRSENGNTYWKREKGWREQYSTKLKISGGQALFDFDFQRGGRFFVRCTYRDSKGRAYTTGTIYNVGWPYRWYQEETWNPTYESIQILPDRREYAVGDTMRLQIRSERRPASCILTIERGSVLEYQVVKLEGNEIRIPVTADFRPNVYISVLGTLARSDFPTYQGEFDTGAPAFVFGTVNVKVRNDVEELSVAIGAGEKEIKARPGSEMTLDLNVADSRGAGVVAEMAVAVVDERVLALTNYRTPTLQSLLDFIAPLDVKTGELRTLLQSQTPFSEFRDDPLTGGDGAADAPGGQPVDVEIRKDFNPVAYFNPALLSGKDGHASVTFKFPDTITRYRIFVIACDKGSRVRTEERPAIVAKDFYLEPGLPRFLTRGDTFTFNVTAFNNTELGGPVNFQVESTPGLSLESPGQSEPLGSMNSIMIPVKGTATGAETARINFSGTQNDQSDAVQIELPVNSGYLIDHDFALGTIEKAGVINYSYPPGTEDIPWADTKADEFSCKLTLSGSPFLRMQPGLKYLLHYPYGCIEQTSSGVIPLAALRSIIQGGMIPGITLAETDKFLSSGVERVLSMQTNEGGFSYWPGQRETSNWGTIYGMTALTLARGAGFDVPGERFDKALNYLSNQLLADQGADPIHGQGYGYRGMAAFLLAKNGRLTAEQFRRVDAGFPNMGREDHLLTILAAKYGNLLPDEELARRLRVVLKELPTREEHISWGAIRREPAIALMACNAILPSGTEVQAQARLLRETAGRNGCWSSTSDTGWALLALSEFYGAAFLNRDRISGRIQQAGLASREFVFDASKSASFDIDVPQFLANPSIQVDLTSGNAAVYELALSFPRVDYAKTGHENGFSVHKYIENLEGGDVIRVGDVVKVRVVFDAKSYNYRDVVLDDPLPAGLVAINSVFATEEPIKDKSTAQDEDYWWYYWGDDGFYRFVPNYFELRDDRVLAFRDHIWHSEYQYSYYARAVCAGTFRIPPTKVQLMYRPEVAAYTPESTLVIEERR